MHIFGHRFMRKLNEWWEDEDPIFFVEHNRTIVVQWNGHFMGLVQWSASGSLDVSLPKGPIADIVGTYLRRTLSAFIGNTMIRVIRNNT